MHEPVADGYWLCGMSDSGPEMKKIETRVPSRLDRLPWSNFHWMIVVGLGTVWILDGLEVTIVGSIGQRLTEKGSGLVLDASQIGTAAAFYVAGACIGALFFGQLTDRFGRKKLFLLTLGVYVVATIATAFSFSAWYFFAARFFTGAGIGGEYAAINSAIDELIPARLRGRVDLMINGSFWIGAAGGAVAAIALLDTALFAADVGWRLAFGIGALLGVGILLVRRNVPESPRWLFIHGYDEEAEEIVGDIEEAIEEEKGEELPRPDDSLTIKQRERISFREIAQTAISKYPAAPPSGLPSSSARPSCTTRSPLTSAPCSANSSTSPRARCRSTSQSSPSPTSSGRSCSAAFSTRSAASRW
jgi:MFS family permease